MKADGDAAILETSDYDLQQEASRGSSEPPGVPEALRVSHVNRLASAAS